MDKKDEIGVNESSGAKKVESIAAATPTANGYTNPADGANSYLGTPFMANVIGGERELTTGEKERLAAEKRARDAATLRGLKERRKERELRARKERIAQERERIAAERRVNLALKKQEKADEKHARKAERKVRNQEERSGGQRPKRPNNGGWIAAIVALGTVALSLGAVVTVGAIDMKETKQGVTNACRGNLYELTSLMENVDSDLDRIRVSASPAQQSRILTDLLVQARLAESVIEKLPIEAESNGNVTSFINRTAFTSERLLAKLRNGENLNEADGKELEGLYKVARQVRGLMNEFVSKFSDKDLSEYLKGKGEDMFSEAIKGVENATIEENRLPQMKNPPELRTGASPKDKKEEKITSSEAEKRCREYFSDYAIEKMEYLGETVSMRMETYNFRLTDTDDIELYAQISERGGELVSFDYYKYCTAQNFDLDNAKMIAENFLEKLGLENMEAVKVNQTGATASFTFAYTMDGAVCYSDSVEVKVCEERGVVIGYNGSAYLKNHCERTLEQPKLSMEEAMKKLHEKLQVVDSRVAVIGVKGRERTAYEFVCTSGEETYFVYLDANTGDEISILNSRDLIR